MAAAATDQHFPLEPDVTIINNKDPEPEPAKSEPVESPAKSAPVEVASKPRPIPEYTSAEELKERRSHRYVSVGGEETIISMDMVKPYKKLIQHAGMLSLKPDHPPVFHLMDGGNSLASIAALLCALQECM